MKTTVIILMSFVSLGICHSQILRDSLGMLSNDYKYGIHCSNLDYLSFYQSFAIHDKFRRENEDKGIALSTWIGLNSIMAGIEYVDRRYIAAITHSTGSNTTVGIAYLRIFGNLIGENRIGNYYGLVVGDNWYIFNGRFGYFRNIISQAPRKDLWLFQIGVIY